MWLDRRGLLAAAGALPLAACARPSPPLAPAFAARAPLAPLRLSPERLVRITTCLRPFRREGPRIEAETLGDKRIVHNYGHGGSGWSLCWGSAELAAMLALEGGTPAADAARPRRRIAVIGAGAIGLTTALTLQRAGAEVTIHARERPANTRSSRATGTWSPDSRIADSAATAPDFAARWESMARRTWAGHLALVGAPGEPVAFTDRWVVTGSGAVPQPPSPLPEIAFFHGDRLRDIVPAFRAMPVGGHPFGNRPVRHGVSMQFNIHLLQRLLTADFLREGGRILPADFRTPADLFALPEPVIVNCTGYGARALWADDSIIPVRGQLAWLPAQPEAPYGLYYRGVSSLSRPDGLILQFVGNNDMLGVGDEKEAPDRAEALAAINTLGEIAAS